MKIKASVKCQCSSSKQIEIFRACLLLEGSVGLCTNGESPSLMLWLQELWRRFLLAQGTRAGCTSVAA